LLAHPVVQKREENSADLVDVVVVDGGVEDGIKVVEKRDDLKRRAEGGDCRETDDVAEVDGHLVIPLRVHGLSGQQTLRHRPMRYIVTSLISHTYKKSSFFLCFFYRNKYAPATENFYTLNMMRLKSHIERTKLSADTFRLRVRI